MMKAFKIFLVLVILSVTIGTKSSYAQCAMCAMNAESSVRNGNKQGTGLNKGILYLLAAPYLAVIGVGYIWHRKYRRKNVALNMKDEKINLN
jgi:hypothetical protein